MDDDENEAQPADDENHQSEDADKATGADADADRAKSDADDDDKADDEKHDDGKAEDDDKADGGNDDHTDGDANSQCADGWQWSECDSDADAGRRLAPDGCLFRRLGDFAARGRSKARHQPRRDQRQTRLGALSSSRP